MKYILYNTIYTISFFNKMNCNFLEIKTKLKYILDTSIVNHDINIIQQNSIKDAHIYCKVNNLPGQVSGPLIEKYIKNKYFMIKNNSSSCTGDLFYKGINIELKVSNGGKSNNKFNYVQLRMNHCCNYFLTAYHISNENINNLGELFIFKINKNEMKDLILKYGGYAHGTVRNLGKISKEDLDDITNDKEYAIRPKYGDKCWNELLTYSVKETDI